MEEIILEIKFFGFTPDGQEAYTYSLSNKNGIKAEITNYGGTIVSLFVPDKRGRREDVVLGFGTLEGYTKPGPYFGAIIGRHANRIEDAVFELNGEKYKLKKNDGNNHLHGGVKGFDSVCWRVSDYGENKLFLSYLSIDGEEGYPGTLNVSTYYTLTDNNELVIEYEAESGADTIVNLTNHSYFNLGGHCSGNILNHFLKINADKFTVNNQEGVPNGEIRDVTGTPMDFRHFRMIKSGIESDFEQIRHVSGYDHNFVLNKNEVQTEYGTVQPEYCAEVYEPISERRMKVYTTKPGVQLYTGNGLSGYLIGKGSVHYQKWSGLCLETQFFPNSMKHSHFPSPILRREEKYNHKTIYRFEV